MATALPTVAVSLVFLLWDACRRAHRRPAPPAEAAPLPGGEGDVEDRLDRLTFLAQPLLRRRR
jgi:hypothetical protein